MITSAELLVIWLQNSSQASNHTKILGSLCKLQRCLLHQATRKTRTKRRILTTRIALMMDKSPKRAPPALAKIAFKEKMLAGGGPLWWAPKFPFIYKEGIPLIYHLYTLTYIILANLSVLYSLYNFPVLILLALLICIGVLVRSFVSNCFNFLLFSDRNFPRKEHARHFEIDIWFFSPQILVDIRYGVVKPELCPPK